MAKLPPTIETLRIATRQSPLALWQAEHVKAKLSALYPDLTIELLGITTQGDKLLDKALYELGGKSLFLKELEQAIVEGRADIAVHSMKDVPVELPDGLAIHAILEREDPRDAFVSNDYQSLAELPDGAILGTASLRRQAQIARLRPDLNFKIIRGNVGTRLQKLDNQEYDAIILAAAGLKRLGLEHRLTMPLSIDDCLPSVAQGIIGIETRADDRAMIELLAPLNDAEAVSCLTAERQMNAVLGGGCHIPVAGHAYLTANDGIEMRGLVASTDGKDVISAKLSGPRNTAQELGESLGKKLLEQGAGRIIQNG